MQHCPWCGRAVQRIEKRYRCWHCFTTSKGYSDFERFNKEWMILAREIRGLTVTELAQMIDGDVADIVRWEEGSPFIAANTIARLADALDFPVAFFHQQEAVEPLGETTLDWHSKVVWCECGGVLGDVGNPLPLLCPTCYAVVEGCPQCDHDLERERLGKVVAIYCPACKWTRKVL